mgnify:CR=1 FL=1
MRFATALAAGALTTISAGAAARPTPSAYVQRLSHLAQLQTLNADLLSHDSATGVLQALCDRRDDGAPRIRARRVTVADDAAATSKARAELGAAPDAAIVHRRVELMCGAAVLSRADNWYLPGRLTPDMNAALTTTETPFGVVVRPLGFQRRTLSARLLYQPLPVGWDARPAATNLTPARPPDDVLQHRAVLQTPDGVRFSLVVETYTNRVLAP